MADKNYIADKQTLGVPNPTAGDSSTVMNYLKKIDDYTSEGIFIAGSPGALHESNIIKDITGKGVLGLVSSSNPSTSNQFAIQIDGGTIEKISVLGSLWLPLPFKEWVKVTSNSSGSRVSYKLI